MKSKNKITIITILSIISISLLVSLYFISFRTIVLQILDRGESDSNNLVGLVEKLDSVDNAVINFNNSRDLEIIVVDSNYQVLKSTASTLRTQVFSNNITHAKSEGSAYSFIKRDTGKSLSLIYSKRGIFKGEIIVVSIEYPFISYHEFKQILISIIILSLLIIIFVTYLITAIYLNSYMFNLNRFVEANHVYNELNNRDLELTTSSDNKEVIKLIETLNTFKKKYDAILENDKKRFSKINSFLSNVPTGIIVIDNNREISLMNEKVNSLLKIDKRQIIHHNNIRGFDHIYSLWEKVIKDKKTRLEDISVDEKILEIEARAMIDRYSPYEFIGVLFLVRDVTKVREISNVKDDFVSNVSHELRTPLTIINGFAQALNNKNISDEDKSICIDSINSEVKKLSFLITELLHLSKVDHQKETDKLVQFNPFEIIKDQIAVYSHKALEKNISIQLELDDKVECNLFTNEVYFRQIINNLLDNAIKYSNSNSKIIIRESLNSDDYIFSITDYGIGIETEYIGNIFDRFYRVEKSRNSEIAGSGLGLSIVKLFLEAIGGTIQVDSELGKGSTFTINIKRNYNA